MWHARSGKQVTIHKQLTSFEYILDGTAVFSRNGRLVVTASGDFDARVWEAASGKQVAVLHGHRAEVLSAAFDPDGRRVVTASADGTARVWETVSGRQLAVLRVHANTRDAGLAGSAGWVDSAVFSPDGSLIVAARRRRGACLCCRERQAGRRLSEARRLRQQRCLQP